MYCKGTPVLQSHRGAATFESSTGDSATRKLSVMRLVAFHARRSEPDGRFLYLLPDSVTAQSLLDGERGGREKPPVPPCILPIDTNATQISLEIDDRSGSRLFKSQEGCNYAPNMPSHSGTYLSPPGCISPAP